MYITRSIFVALVAILFWHHSYAKKVDMKGKIITTNDTLEVTFRVPVDKMTGNVEISSLQSSIEYYYVEGNKLFVTPKIAIAIIIETKFEGIIRLYKVKVERQMGLGKELYYFLERKVSGKANLYEFNYSQYNGDSFSMSSNKGYVLEKRGRTYTFYYRVNKTDLALYFADCKELRSKIESREFNYKELEEIVRYYNNHCD